MISHFVIFDHFRLKLLSDLPIKPQGFCGFYRFGMCTARENTRMWIRVDADGALAKALPSFGYYNYCCEQCLNNMIDEAWLTPESAKSRRILDSNWIIDDGVGN